jgi:alpha-beta hydrolase superfamily lysophospholipase
MSIQSHTARRPDLIQLPVLFIHGSDDPLNLLSGVRRFFKNISYPDKQLQVYQGSLHEPHNDLEHDQVAQDLINWLDGHLPKRSVPQPDTDVLTHKP